MRATMEGEILGSGEVVFEGKTYPFFEMLQRAEGRIRSKVIQIRGNMSGFEVGDNASVYCYVSVNNTGQLRVKRIER